MKLNYISLLAILLIGMVFLSSCMSQESPTKAPTTTQPSDTPETTQQETTSQQPDKVIDKGDFKVVYDSVENPDFIELEKVLKESKLFEEVTNELNNNFALPYDILVVFEECGEENAFYDSNTKQITMCYELMGYFAKVFYDYSEDDNDLGTAMLNSMFFAFYHEVGHMMVDIYDLPATGNSEDNADQVSTLILLSDEADGVSTLLNGANWFFIKSEESDIEESIFSDIHSPDKRRYYNLLCWIYGSDPENGEYIITEWELPEERAIGCEEEYNQMSNSWDRLLSPYFK